MRPAARAPFCASVLVLLALLGCATTAGRVQALREKADAGDAGAQVALAQRYADGEGVERDAGRAADLYRKAAEAGNAEGQLALGILHREGVGVAQDHQEAQRWIRKAAEAGSPKAQFLLGIMCEEGDGVPKDLVAAHAWLNLAAAGLPPEEREPAARRRDWLSEVMTPSQIAEAQRLAREWGQRKR